MSKSGLIAEHGGAATDAAGGKQEPVHEDAFAVVVRVVGKKSVPFVFLLAAAIADTSLGLDFPERKTNS